MDISRRIAMVSLGLAAAAGLAFPAILTRSSEPPLVQPVEISGDKGSATGSAPSSAPVDVPREPVPVVPHGERDDNARTGVDDDDADDERNDGDGDDRDDDGASRGGGSGGGDDSGPGGDDTDEGGSSDG